MKSRIVTLVSWLGCLQLLGACEPPSDTSGPSAAANAVAERYVHVALAFANHDASYVDAYFGPPEWQSEAAADQSTLAAQRSLADQLIVDLDSISTAAMEPIEQLRIGALRKRIDSMRLRMDMADGRRLPFDQESEILFDAVAPDNDTTHFEAIIRKIDALVPGEEPLAARVDAFRRQFVIPPGRLAAVFDAAIAECRRRTLEHIELPNSESFAIEYVTDQPWSGYNWYKGGFFSLIQINTELPIFIERAVEIGCHEGYPGHHTYNVLLERELVDGRGWVEFTVNPLYGPQSLISEGSANFGVDLAFPGQERAAFERAVLFPLAGLDAAEADRFYALADLLSQLSYAGNEAARDYLNGEISAAQAVDWLVEYTLTTADRAAQRLRFFDTYRSYVINYNLGQDVVGAYIERQAGENPDRRWSAFAQLLTQPMTPADLQP